MSVEFEINVGKEAEPTPEEKAAKEAEKKAKLDELWSTLRAIMTGKSGLTGVELQKAQEAVTKEIAECMED